MKKNLIGINNYLQKDLRKFNSHINQILQLQYETLNLYITIYFQKWENSTVYIRQ